MRGLHLYGDVEKHTAWIEAAGWTVASSDAPSKHLLVCTHDNKAADPRERLQGTIQIMRDAMTHVQNTKVDCVVLTTDGAGYAGTRTIADAPKSATFVDAHGMGSLTAEVLAQIARSSGAEVSIVYGDPRVDAEVRDEILNVLEMNRSE